MRGYFLVALGALVLGLGWRLRGQAHRTRLQHQRGATRARPAVRVAILTSPSLECPSRICLLPAPMGTSPPTIRPLEGRCARPAARRTTTARDTRSRHARARATSSAPGRPPPAASAARRCASATTSCSSRTGGIPEPTTCMSPPSGPSPRPARTFTERPAPSRLPAPAQRSGAELEGVRDVDDLGRAAVLPERHRHDVEAVRRRLTASRPPGRGAPRG